MLWFLGVVCFLDVFWWGECYNVDVDHPIIYENPEPSQERSYFGYSLVLYGDKDKKWIKVGAPKATYNGPAGSVYQSGVVYHCPFMTNACKIEEKLNYSAHLMNSWIGGAMDISYRDKIVGISASGLQEFKPKSARMVEAKMPGAIFVEHLERHAIEERYSPLKKPVWKSNYAYYARSSTGFSLHFLQNQNEILVGAPGVYNFLGTVFRIKGIDRNQKDWKHEVISPNGAFYEYSGYALTSGCFYKKGELKYVTGAPRGIDSNRTILDRVSYGLVLVFNFNSARKGRHENQVMPIVHNQIYGTQVWEYFGAALAAGDLNGDGLDDLVVGAPFRRNDKSGFNHGSVYVFYGNSRKLKYYQKNRIDGMESGGRFGAALMVLGDLDGDGMSELAVSAPNEEESGVIYVYAFDKVMKTLRASQKIRGKDIHPDLRGFGTSFSRAKDIDDNYFADFAVGSPLSGHAVIFRSKPIVTINASIEVPSSISKSINYFSFQCCYDFTGHLNSSITIIRNLTVDGDFNRFYFNKGIYSQEKRIVVMQRNNMKQCESINITKKNHKNYDDPISITLTYRIPDDLLGNKRNTIVIKHGSPVAHDTFCKTCPLLSKKSKTSDTKLVIWDHSCDHNGRKEPCISKLEVNAKFLNLREENTVILGSKRPLNLVVSIVNNGDPAFSPSLQISLPNGVIRVGSANCRDTDATSITCESGEVLNEKVTYNLKLMVISTEITELSFFFNASTITENIQDRSTLTLSLKVKRDADFFITGYSKEPSYVYEKKKPITLIQNIFKIEKFGPSPTPPAEVTIIIPYKIRGLDGTYAQFTDVVERNDTYSDNSVVKCDENLEEIETSLTQFKDDSSKLFHVACPRENITCASLKCLVGSLEGSQDHVEILVDMEVDFQKLEAFMGNGWLTEVDQMVITSGAKVFAEGFIQSGNRSDFTQLSNLVLVYKDPTISLWIWIGSAIAGFVVLICVALAMTKAGFFERKKHKMLLQLKEEAKVLEEERLIEEMIQKEQGTEKPFEGDLMFRYITPQDLELYQKNLEEMPLHNDPCVAESNTKKRTTAKNSEKS